MEEKLFDQGTGIHGSEANLTYHLGLRTRSERSGRTRYTKGKVNCVDSQTLMNEF